MNRLLVLSLLIPAISVAAPLELNHQGRLLDSTGVALDSTEDVTFAIYGDLADTSAVWTETHSVTFDGGYYNVQLGSIEDLDSDLFDGSTLYVGITVGTDPELSNRLAIHATPYAITAGAVNGGPVDASSVSVGGTEVISTDGTIAYDAIVGAPTSPLDDLSCNSGEVVTWDGSAWSCDLANPVHEHAASDITSGKLAIDLIPVGTGADDVAAGNHSHTAEDVGALAIGGGTLTGDLAVQGGVTVGNVTDACASGNAGQIRFVAGALQICDGSAWLGLTASSTAGSAADNAAESCKAIYDDNRAAANGTYWIDPDGSGGIDAWEANCDIEGGGWTEIPYAEDLEYKRQFTTGDGRKWLAEDFSLDWSDAQIAALRAVSTEGKQDYIGRCNGVIHYRYANDGSYTYALGFRFQTTDESPIGVQNYAPYDISVSQDGCQSNGGENGTDANSTNFQINSLLVPVINVNTNDNGDAGELFGSDLTKNPAWMR